MSHFHRVDTVRGFPMWVDLRDETHGARVAIARDWEPALSDLVSAEIRPSDRVVVAGANAGWYALLCSRAECVTAYEPGPSWHLLTMNGRSGVVPIMAALGDENCTVGMTVPPTDAYGWPIGPHATGCARTTPVGGIQMITMDDAESGADVVIVDVEGDEWRVWNGARRIRKSVRLWVTEVSPSLCDYVGRLLTEMVDEGFTVTAMHPDLPPSVPATHEILTQFEQVTLVGRR